MLDLDMLLRFPETISDWMQNRHGLGASILTCYGGDSDKNTADRESNF